MADPDRRFYELAETQAVNRKQLCVGLDSDIVLIRQRLHEMGNGFPRDLSDSSLVGLFSQKIVEVTADIAGAYKPNSSFYEKLGLRGVSTLKRVVETIHYLAPDVPVIDDAKRGDIGNTNTGYVESIFDYYNFDAVTVSPYLGGEALSPFLKRSEKGIIVLGRTSNPGLPNPEFSEPQEQNILLTEAQLIALLNGPARSLGIELPENGSIKRLIIEDTFGKGLLIPGYYTTKLFSWIAYRVSNHWNVNGNCAIVAGATYPAEAGMIRDIVGDDFFKLIPGVGAQGGEVADIVPMALKRGQMGVINVSRDISFPKLLEGEKYFDGVRRMAEMYHNQIVETQNSLLVA